jgi:hypothetical protein
MHNSLPGISTAAIQGANLLSYSFHTLKSKKVGEKGVE